MDLRSALRTIIATLVGIGLVVLIIILLVKAFSGGGAPANEVNVGKYGDTNATATLLIDGPTNLDQDHRQVRISVSGTQNQIDIISGYQGDIIKSQTYPNNSAAFTVFLQSLQLLGFSKGTRSTIDYRGYCPTGDRYLYSFSDDNSELFSYWSTSCGGQGTFRGNPPAVRSLFEDQVPQRDLVTLTGNTDVTL